MKNLVTISLNIYALNSKNLSSAKVEIPALTKT
jgi:hypothetical protein